MAHALGVLDVLCCTLNPLHHSFPLLCHLFSTANAHVKELSLLVNN